MVSTRTQTCCAGLHGRGQKHTLTEKTVIVFKIIETLDKDISWELRSRDTKCRSSSHNLK